MNEKAEVFISVDVETSGPIPGEYSLLAIGACLASDDTRTFACQVKPVNANAIPEAMKVTGLSMQVLERDGLTPADAMSEFEAWIASVVGPEERPVFVGLNAAFDWSFVNYYFHRFLGRNPFGFTALDIKSLYMGATGCGWFDTRSSRIDARLKPQLRGDHDALHDARYQAEIFRLVRALATQARPG
jgi:DNA polymerase III epsilon subunit-like protein